jgi:hypothetical protein
MAISISMNSMLGLVTRRNNCTQELFLAKKSVVRGFWMDFCGRSPPRVFFMGNLGPAVIRPFLGFIVKNGGKIFYSKPGVGLVSEWAYVYCSGRAGGAFFRGS